MTRTFASRELVCLLLSGLAILAGCGGAEPPPQPPPQPPAPPPVVVAEPPQPALATLTGARMMIRSSLNDGFCVDDNGGGTKDGNQIFIWACAQGQPGGQAWSFGPAPGGANVITGLAGKCLSIKAEATDKGVTELSTCDGGPRQLFKHYADGRFHDGVSNKCLTATSAAKGAPIILEACNPASAGQVWSLVEAPPAPPPAAKRIEITADRVRLNEEILFKTGSHEIDPKSEEFVAYIAFILKEHQGLDFVEVAGHADKRGGDATNVPLTQKRADEVVKHLAAQGVDPVRLRGIGYGSYCPIDAADNDAAYAKNRRVEFRILRLEGRDLATRWDGCDEAKKHGMKPVPIPKTAPKTKVRSGKIVILRKGDQLLFADEVRFEPGSAALHPASTPVLESLRTFLDKDKTVTKIRVEGHTDSAQNTPELMALSKDRSKAVAEWLVNHGIAPGRILPVGCGSSRPIKNAEGQVDHKKTKRTEVHIVEERGKPLGTPVPADCAVD